MAKGLIQRAKSNGNAHKPIPTPEPERVSGWLKEAIAAPSFMRLGLRVIDRGGETMVCRLTSNDPIGTIRHPTPTRSLPIIHIYNHLFHTLIKESENDNLRDYIHAHTQG